MAVQVRVGCLDDERTTGAKLGANGYRVLVTPSQSIGD
jgi:hypothetical protein